MRRTLLFVLVLIISLSPVLVACDNNSSASATNTAEATIPVGDEDNMYIWWDSDPDAATVINTAVVDFFEANPEYEGKTITAYTPASQDRSALEINIAGRTAPSMVRMDHVYISALGSNGNLENLLDSKYNFGQYEDKFIPSTWDGVKYKDEIYGIPFDANTICLMYNKGLLNEAGVGVPTSYQELLDAGKAVKALPRNDVWGTSLAVGASSDNWSTFSFLFWLWRLGGDVLNEDYTEATFNQAPGIEAMDKFYEMVNVQQIAPKSANDGGWAEIDFIEKENIATIETGQWRIPEVSANENFGFAPMITLKEDVPNYSGLGLYALSVVSESAGNVNTKLAYDFALHLGTTAEYQTNFCRPKNFTPSLIEATKDPYFSDEVHKVFVDQLAVTKSRPGVACWPQIEEAINVAIAEVIFDGRSSTEALNSAATRVNQMLKSENENYEEEKNAQQPQASATAE